MTYANIRSLETTLDQVPQFRTRRSLADALDAPELLDESDEEKPLRVSEEDVEFKGHDRPRPVRERTVKVEAIIVGGYRGEAMEPTDEEIRIVGDIQPGEKVVRVLGDSMEPLLHSGDLVIIDTKHRRNVPEGRPVAIRVNGESTIKLLHRLPDGRVGLKPANPAYREETVPASAVEIRGEITEIVRRRI